VSKQIIPEVRATDAYDFLFKKAVKDNIDQLTGVTLPRLEPLTATATLADVIMKVNELVARLNHK